MNKTICISDFSFDDEILRKLNEFLDNSLRKPKSYFMRIDIHFPKNLDQKTISTFSQRFAEKINDKTFFRSRIKNDKVGYYMTSLSMVSITIFTTDTF